MTAPYSSPELSGEDGFDCGTAEDECCEPRGDEVEDEDEDEP